MSEFYLKLRYRGRLRNPEEVELLADEVEDICRSRNWKYHRWEEDWSKPATVKVHFEEGGVTSEGHAPLRGITFKPHPECETVWLTFTPDGILQTLFTLDDPTWTVNDAEHPWSRVKTGFDGAVTHRAICQLFFYLEGKYFADFACLDESGYWRHRDDARLEAFMTSTIAGHAQLESELQALEADESLDPSVKHKIFYDLMRAYGERHKPDRG